MSTHYAVYTLLHCRSIVLLHKLLNIIYQTGSTAAGLSSCVLVMHLFIYYVYTFNK